MKRGAIFDMDGTLLDTEKFYAQAWLMAAEEFGEEKIFELPKAVSGTSLDAYTERIIKSFYPDIDAKKYIARVLEIANNVPAENLAPKLGAVEILEFFKAAGVEIAVASSAKVSTIYRNLTRANLRGYFEILIGGDKVSNGKPAPDIFLLAAKELNLPASDCYIFEDSFNGVRAAHASGGAAIMIPDTVPPTDEIKKLCAAIFPSFIEAKHAIEEGRL